MDVSDAYRRNVNALTAFHPRCAEVVDAIAIPDTVIPAVGRDGSNTFLIREANGAVRWFGGSSMPSISAAELLFGFCSDGSNTALPGILTGLEPLMLLERMPTHAAVFVIEPDPLALKLAMCLWDYAQHFETGRLVFIPASDEKLTDRLHDFFRHHPGYDMPRHLQAIPLQSAADIARLQRGLETASDTIRDLQTRTAREHLQTLHEPRRGPIPDPPRVAVVTLDARPEVLQRARAVGRALSNLNWPHALCLPDAPGRYHVTARLSSIVRLRADVVLMVNGGAASLGDPWPERLPVIEWYWPDARMPSAPPVSQPWIHRFVISRPQRDSLAKTGIDPETIGLCPMGVDDTIFYPLARPAGGEGVELFDVVVLADLPDDQPEACGVNLISHVALWRAALRLADQTPGRYVNKPADVLLSRAERVSGTTLEEPSVRAQFQQWIRERILPAAMARASVGAVWRSSRRVAIWGGGWETFSKPEGVVHHGAIPVGEQINTIVQRSRSVVLPMSDSTSLQTALNVLAGGRPVVLRRPPMPLASMMPGMDDLLPFLPTYQTTHELTRLVDDDLSNAADTAQRIERARSMLLQGHTMAIRLTEMVGRARENLDIRD